MRSTSARTSSRSVTDRTNRSGDGAAGSVPGASSARFRWIAHRGWSARFPENSIPGLASAVAVGADEIEFDVRQTADGVPVLLHDAVVDRVTSIAGDVAALRMDDLLHVDVAAPQGAAVPRLGVARLETVLAMFAPHVGMNIHVKVLDEAGGTLDLIEAAALAHPERFIYVAGDETILEAARDRVPDVPRFCLARQRDPQTLIETAVRFGCRGLQFRATAYDAAAVTEANAHNLLCNLFYADTVADARRAVESGIDGLLTNDIGVLKPALDGGD